MVGRNAGVHLAGKVGHPHPAGSFKSMREAEEVGKEAEASSSDMAARRHAAAERVPPGVLGRLPGLVAASPHPQEKLAEA